MPTLTTVRRSFAGLTAASLVWSSVTPAVAAPLIRAASPTSSISAPAIAVPSIAAAAATAGAAEALRDSAARDALAVRSAPILEINRILQEAGVGTAQPDSPSVLSAIARKLREGSPARAALGALARAAGAGASARRYELDRAWEDVSAPYEDDALLPPAKPARGRKPALTDLSRLRVPLTRLRWSPDPSLVPDSTARVAPDPSPAIGQDQGLRSLIRGLRMPGRDANLYLSGADERIRNQAAVREASALARNMPRGDDMLQVRNFADPTRPQILTLPAGTGRPVAAAVSRILDALGTAPTAIAALHQDEETSAEFTRLQPLASKALAPLRREIDATVVEGAFRLKMVEAKSASGYSADIKLADDEGRVLDDEDLDRLDAKGIDVDGLLAKMDEVAGDFKPRLQAALAPIKARLGALEQRQRARRTEVIATIIDEAQKPLRRIAQNLTAAPDVQNLIRADLKSSRRATAQQEAAAVADKKARLTAWDDAAAAFRYRGYRLSIPAGRSSRNPLITYREVPLEQAIADPVRRNKIKAKVLAAAQVLLDERRGIEESAAERRAELSQWRDEDADSAKSRAPSYRLTSWARELILDLAKNHDQFTGKSAPVDNDMAKMFGMGGKKEDPRKAYEVRLLVDNSRAQGAPIVIPTNYSWRALFGAAGNGRRGLADMMDTGDDGKVPDLVAGDLQKANGGFLILDVERLLANPDLYSGLMDMLDRGEAEFTEDGALSVVYDNRGRYPVPIKVKVVFTGPAMYRHMLEEYDLHFSRLFGLAAEFESAVYVGGSRAAEVVTSFAASMRATVDEDRLLHFSKEAIIALLERAARFAESNEMINLSFAPLQRLMREASMIAGDAGRRQVGREDVDQAILAESESRSLYRDILYNLIADGSFPINVEGEKKDTLTAVAVIGDDDGVPMRLSVKTHASKDGELVASTEAHAKLVGTSFIQSIGNVTGYFEGILGRDETLPFSALVKFEQDYDGVDGDSATQAMILLIGASLADVPLRQNYVMTGSTDQDGFVRVIGGINQKIQGAWDVYREILRRKGRAPSAAEPYHFIMPAANIRDLALRSDVADAVREGKLILIPVVHVSQGFELMTGLPYAELIRRWESYRRKIYATAAARSTKPRRSPK